MAVYKVTATKANLLNAKSNLIRMKKAYELMDKKRLILRKEADSLENKNSKLYQKINKVLYDYYAAMDHAFITVGTNQIRSAASRVPIYNSIDIVEKSLMGMPLPLIKGGEESVDMAYITSNMALDQAVFALEAFRNLIVELATVENSLSRLEKEIKKTEKRANALEKVQIPNYEKIIRDMEEVLEEKEREEFFRMKRVKKLHRKKVSYN